MLFRHLVVWLYSLAVLLGASKSVIQVEFTGSSALLDSSHVITLLPTSEPSFNSLRPLSDNNELLTPQLSTIITQFSVNEHSNTLPSNTALGSLCRGMPIGQAPPLVF